MTLDALRKRQVGGLEGFDPLKGRNEVKDNREWKLADNGADAWASRQFGH